MSFLGTVGHLMQGSGLSSIFDLIYADSTVPYIICGKAVSRATRAHLILYACLIAIQVTTQFNFDILIDDDGEYSLPKEIPEEIKSLFNLSQELSEGEISIEVIEQNETFLKLKEMITSYRNQRSESKTAQLWFQYMDTVEVLCRFIHAKRSGNWELHLQATRDMLPYFAASGHYLYAKSTYLYLQTMVKLSETHPSVYKHFLDGFHVVRRSNRFWAGLSTDLVIEQVLMRSIKTTGGLTRGRGFTDIQRAVWLMSTPVTAAISQAMQNYTGTSYQTSERHKETMVPRLSRDHSDALKIVTYLSDRNPFNISNDLMNISTGEVCNEKVNVYQAKEIGETLIISLKDLSVFDYSFRKRDMAVTMPTKSSVTIDNENVSADSHLLFQRLITIARHSPEEMEKAFTFELSTFLASLFDKDGLMNDVNKPQLSHAIWKAIEEYEVRVPDGTYYIIDGGALLQRIPWIRGQTFESICQTYIKYILKHFGAKVIVVFDGYHGPSTKDTTHLRRSKGRKSSLFKVSLKNKLTVQKEIFLLNQHNKQGFLNILGQELTKANITVKHVIGDADLLIVQTALDIAKENTVTVIGEDTDFLILLLYHKSTKSMPVYLTGEEKSNMKPKPKIWDIQYAKEKLGDDLCNSLLAVHALLGCDTTSRIHGVGKATAFRKFKTNDEFRLLIKTLSSDSGTKADILAAGERLLLM